MNKRYLPKPPTPVTDGAPPHKAPRFEARILQLVPGTRERRAIMAGEVDAILDADSGQAILLPAAQVALLKQKHQFHGLIELASDGYWEQDEDGRFKVCSGLAIGAARCEDTRGRLPSELRFEGEPADAANKLMRQIAQRIVFRDLELTQRDGDGALRHLSLSGEPRFDNDGCFRGFRGVTREITARGQIESQLGTSLAFEYATLDALAWPVCLLDGDDRVVAGNHAWREWSDLGAGGVALGSLYRDACREQPALLPIDAEPFAAGLAQVRRGERSLFRCEHHFRAAAGPRCVMVSVSAVHSADDTQAMLMLVHEDITEQHSNTRWQTLESTVAVSLAQAPDTAAALQAVLAAVCEARHWDCGQYFEHDVASASLGHVAKWSHARASEVEAFLARSPIGRFRADAGLAGRVCRAKQPVWVSDAHHDVRHGAALPHEVGLRGLFICPVGVDGALDGVLVFGSREELTELDEHGLRAVATIGKLLGHFLRREAEKRRLIDSEQRYRRYTALACDWQWQLDSELRFVESSACSIDAGGEIIGKRLWELPHLRVAADEWARLQAEIVAQWSFCDFECVAVQNDGRERRYTLSGEPMFDAAGLFCGVLGVGLDITQRAR